MKETLEEQARREAVSKRILSAEGKVEAANAYIEKVDDRAEERAGTTSIDLSNASADNENRALSSAVADSRHGARDESDQRKKAAPFAIKLFEDKWHACSPTWLKDDGSKYPIDTAKSPAVDWSSDNPMAQWHEILNGSEGPESLDFFAVVDEDGKLFVEAKAPGEADSGDGTEASVTHRVLVASLRDGTHFRQYVEGAITGTGASAPVEQASRSLGPIVPSEDGKDYCQYVGQWSYDKENGRWFFLPEEDENGKRLPPALTYARRTHLFRSESESEGSSSTTQALFAKDGPDFVPDIEPEKWLGVYTAQVFKRLDFTPPGNETENGSLDGFSQSFTFLGTEPTEEVGETILKTVVEDANETTTYEDASGDASSDTSGEGS